MSVSMMRYFSVTDGRTDKAILGVGYDAHMRDAYGHDDCIQEALSRVLLSRMHVSMIHVCRMHVSMIHVSMILDPDSFV